MELPRSTDFCFCSYSVQPTKYIWGWSFASILTHFLGDWLVHNHDIAIYPSSADGVKYGIGLWVDIPRTVWFGELLLIGIGAGAASAVYGTHKLRSPTILMLILHSMNYSGVLTNLPYTFGRLFQNNPNLLRLAIGVTLISTYLFPALYTSYVLDKKDGS